jgi:hypothetical protein
VVRKHTYGNGGGHAPAVAADAQLAGARAKLEAAAARLREAEGGDVSRPSWAPEYEAAETGERVARRRVEVLERLRAAQLERGGRREAAAAAMAADMKAMAAALAASRDQVAAAAAAHLKALAALASAAAAHNELLAGSRDRAADAGLAVLDDLLDEGQEHGEGTLNSDGLRAGGVDWLPVPGAGLAAHACRLVFGPFGPRNPLAEAGKYTWRPWEVEDRADGLKVPGLADAGAKPPLPPPRPVARAAMGGPELARWARESRRPA